MPDNSSIPVASGNETFANHDIGGIKYPRVRATWGPTGVTNDVDVASGKPMPVQQRTSTGLEAVIPGTAATNLGKALDGVAGATDTVVPTAGVRTDTPAPITPVVGDWAPLRVDNQGKLWVNMGAVVLGGGTANIGDVDVASLPVQFDHGPATATTIRTTIDEDQLGALVVSSVPVITGGFMYVDIPANTSSAKILESSAGAASGSPGNSNYLEHLICVVDDPAACVVSIQDGLGGSWTALPANVAGGIGVYHVAYGILGINPGGWRVSTQTGVTVRATGRWP
jgi:hypothetical protein